MLRKGIVVFVTISFLNIENLRRKDYVKKSNIKYFISGVYNIM